MDPPGPGGASRQGVSLRPHSFVLPCLQKRTRPKGLESACPPQPTQNPKKRFACGRRPRQALRSIAVLWSCVHIDTALSDSRALRRTTQRSEERGVSPPGFKPHVSVVGQRRGTRRSLVAGPGRAELFASLRYSYGPLPRTLAAAGEATPHAEELRAPGSPWRGAWGRCV
jgi:hypothetical protein